MANLDDARKKAKTIALKDGKERYLNYDLNALAELEDRYGSVEKAFKKLEEGSIKALKLVLWAGLVHEDSSLTEQKVGSLVDIEYLQNLQDSLGSALAADMPDPVDSKDSSPNV